MGIFRTILAAFLIYSIFGFFAAIVGLIGLVFFFFVFRHHYERDHERFMRTVEEFEKEWGVESSE